MKRMSFWLSFFFFYGRRHDTPITYTLAPATTQRARLCGSDSFIRMNAEWNGIERAMYIILAFI